MLMIRLQRVGRKNEPVFRLVLTDSKNSTKSGKYIEVLGSYDPRQENKIEQFDMTKVKEYIARGAQLSDTVHNFLVSRKAIDGKKRNALPKKTPIKKDVEAEVKTDIKADAKTEVKIEEKTETKTETKTEIEKDDTKSESKSDKKETEKEVKVEEVKA